MQSIAIRRNNKNTSEEKIISPFEVILNISFIKFIMFLLDMTNDVVIVVG